jgi:hypothetical protein
MRCDAMPMRDGLIIMSSTPRAAIGIARALAHIHMHLSRHRPQLLHTRLPSGPPSGERRPGPHGSCPLPRLLYRTRVYTVYFPYSRLALFILPGSRDVIYLFYDSRLPCMLCLRCLPEVTQTAPFRSAHSCTSACSVTMPKFVHFCPAFVDGTASATATQEGLKACLKGAQASKAPGAASVPELLATPLS